MELMYLANDLPFLFVMLELGFVGNWGVVSASCQVSRP